MTDSEPSVCEAFFLIADIALSLGVKSINQLPGCWEHKVDDNWTIAVNAHRETVECNPAETMGAEIPGFCAAVWWNGWLAGLIGPGGGSIAAHPDGANEDRLIADLRVAISEASK